MREPPWTLRPELAIWRRLIREQQEAGNLTWQQTRAEREVLHDLATWLAGSLFGPSNMPFVLRRLRRAARRQ